MRHVVLDGVDEVHITVAFDWLLEDSHSRWARFRGLRTLPDDESLWSISVPTQANYESAQFNILFLGNDPLMHFRYMHVYSAQEVRKGVGGR